MRYRLTSLVVLPAGSPLTLTESQASAREHALRSMGGGEYIAMAPVSFKVGEIIGYPGDLPASWGAVLCDDDAPPVAVPAVVQDAAPQAAPVITPNKPRRGRASKVDK